MNRHIYIAQIIGISLVLVLRADNALQFQWVHPAGKATSYLFAPGIHVTERQIAKYCTSYTASTGQTVFAENNFIVLQPPYTAVHFP